MHLRFFSFYVAVRFISLLAERVVIFIVPVAIYIDTQDIFLSGLAYVGQWLPQVLLLPFAGGLTQRFRPAYQFFSLDLLRALLALCIPFFFIGSVSSTIVIVGIITLFSGYSLVIMEAFLSNYAKSEIVPVVQARMSSCYQASLIAGPALGAFLISSFSLAHILEFVAVVFISSSFLCWLLFRYFGYINIDWSNEKKIPPSLFTGFQIVFKSKALMLIMVLTICVNFIEGIIVSQLPAIVTIELGASASEAGFVLSIGAIFSVLTFTFASWLLGKISIETIGSLSIPFMGLGAVMLPFTSTLTTFSFVFSMWVIGRSLYTLWMRSRRISLIPKANAGRALSVFIAGILAGAPLSGIAVATLSTIFDPMKTLVCGIVLVAIFLTAFFVVNKRPSLISKGIT